MSLVVPDKISMGINLKISNNLPEKIPVNSYTDFVPIEEKCRIRYCPNNTDRVCGLCKFHCQTIHQENHTNLNLIELQKLIEEYLKKNER